MLGCALAPIISIALLDRFDSALPVALYVLGGLLITIDEPAEERQIVQDPRRLRPT